MDDAQVRDEAMTIFLAGHDTLGNALGWTGERLCIGMRFAWMAGVLVLATQGQRWRMRLVPGHPIETQPRITLRPKYGLKMKLESRK